MKFRKKPVVIDAVRWFKNGDHSRDDIEKLIDINGNPMDSEGKVVRYFKKRGGSGELPCEYCDAKLHAHGWMETMEGGRIVCPGDWIVTGIRGERYPVKPYIFEQTYEPVMEPEVAAI